MNKSEAAAFLGKLGGQKKSNKKTKAARENGKLGGKKRLSPIAI